MDRPTDWNRYYSRPYKTASFSRAFTTKTLLNSISTHLDTRSDLSIIELGGANSCFLDSMLEKFAPEQYVIIDNNRLGLDLVDQRTEDLPNVETVTDDILNLKYDRQADLVFSVGLIEHFDTDGTRAAINAHFDLLKTGGIAVITFPTPTWLYNLTRAIAELMKMWIFHDERPLKPDEVISTCMDRGQLLEKKIIWPIFLTQGLVVFRKT